MYYKQDIKKMDLKIDTVTEEEEKMEPMAISESSLPE